MVALRPDLAQERCERMQHADLRTRSDKQKGAERPKRAGGQLPPGQQQLTLPAALYCHPVLATVARQAKCSEINNVQLLQDCSP